MKIGIVCYPTFGGSGVVATELGKALSETGNTVHFISYAQPARLNIFSDNLFYHEVSIKNYLFLNTSLRNFFNKQACRNSSI